MKQLLTIMAVLLCLVSQSQVYKPIDWGPQKAPGTIDTIQIRMLVTEDSVLNKYLIGNTYWDKVCNCYKVKCDSIVVNPYANVPKIVKGYSVYKWYGWKDEPGTFTGDHPLSVCRFVNYLDDNKRPLPSYITIWQVKEVQDGK